MTLFALGHVSLILGFHFPIYLASRPTVCVTCVWAGVDSVWEQEKPEARKMPENRADSHTSGAPVWDGDILFHERNRGTIGVYCEWQTRSRTVAVVSPRDSRGAPWLPVRMIHPRVTPCAIPIRKLYTLSDRVCPRQMTKA